MTKSIGDAIPTSIRRRFNGRVSKRRVGFTAALLTASSDAWPSIALLSIGEVLVLDGSTIRMALWPGASSAANLERTHQGTLMMVDADGAFYVQVTAARGDDLMIDGRPRTFFECHVVDVRIDAVPYAQITQGIRFGLIDRDAVLRTWAATIEVLRKAESPTAAAR